MSQDTRRGRSHCQVRPRYTSGSPATVSLGQARRLAELERLACTDALRGGPGDRARAEREGLRGIAEELTEGTRDGVPGWHALDPCTGEKTFRPDRFARPGRGGRDE